MVFQMELHSVSWHETAEKMGTDPERGLSRAEVQKRLSRYGRNEIRESKRQNLLLRFLSQFKDFMVLILLASAAVSFAVSRIRGDSEYIDSIIILIIVVCNAMIGMVQEVRADRAIDALKKLSSPHAQVLRSGRKAAPDAVITEGSLLNRGTKQEISDWVKSL